MIRKQDLNKNWSNLHSILFKSLPENFQEDQKEWLAYHWNLAVGKEIAAISIVERVSRKTLHVKVKGSAWLQTLEVLKKEILQKLNSKAGKQLIEKIKLTV
tara:strand:+ start:429 stop:731 length:303 start_codon:yes stop_codon:yes gene_type:complete